MYFEKTKIVLQEKKDELEVKVYIPTISVMTRRQVNTLVAAMLVALVKQE